MRLRFRLWSRALSGRITLVFLCSVALHILIVIPYLTAGKSASEGTPFPRRSRYHAMYLPYLKSP